MKSIISKLLILILAIPLRLSAENIFQEFVDGLFDKENLVSNIYSLQKAPALIINNVTSSERTNSDLKHESEIQFNVATEFDQYFINQDIWIKAKLINNSGKNYYLKYPFTIVGFSFTILDPLNRLKNVNPGEELVQIIDSVKLSPGEELEKIIPLSMVFEKFLSYEKKIVGTYRISITYQDLKSNELSINVIEPTGIDRELYELTYNELFPSNEQEAQKINKLEKILGKYPSCRYTPQLYDIVLTNLPKQNTERYLKNVYKFFEYNSNTYGAGFIINWLKSYYEQPMKLSEEQINQNLKSYLKNIQAKRRVI